MAEEPEIEEEQNEERHEEPKDDHIPLKDEFSSDLSDIEPGREEEQQEELPRKPDTKLSKKKVAKNYKWMRKWIKISNAIERSKPLLIQKWVRVRVKSENKRHDAPL